LQDIITAFNNGVMTFTNNAGATAVSVVNDALGLNIPLLGGAVSSAMQGLAQKVEAPFQKVFNAATVTLASVNTFLSTAPFSEPFQVDGNQHADGHGTSNNLLEATYTNTFPVAAYSLIVDGSTGFPYLDSGSGAGIFGGLSASLNVTVTVTFGVDIGGFNQSPTIPAFFLLPSANMVSATLTAGTDSNGLTGSLNIGDLTSVTAAIAPNTNVLNIQAGVGLEATAAESPGGGGARRHQCRRICRDNAR
jgi:hypothetical protein